MIIFLLTIIIILLFIIGILIYHLNKAVKHIDNDDELEELNSQCMKRLDDLISNWQSQHKETK